VRSLIDKSRRGRYESVLNDAIPYNSTVLDVGCGTGQLANFLGIGCRRVIGADLSFNSLRLARKFAREQGLPRVKFVQMNLFRPCFKPQQFDVVVCNGVLHHTSDPVGGFQQIARLVKPGGHVVVGVYNTYGRFMTGARRLVAGAAPSRHPHESTHTIGEVLDWFSENQLEFVRGIPRVTLGGEDANRHNLFTPSTRGSKADHFWVQASRVVTGNRDGGSFLMIARKPAAVTAAATQSEMEKRLALSWQ
jgi:SAM-dependent methyltransferase